MGRNKCEINLISNNRVKDLIEKSKMKKCEIADKLYYTPQYISRLCTGKQRVTEEAAKRLSELFPPVRYQYLLAQDDFYSLVDYQKHIKDTMKKYRNAEKMADSAFHSFQELHEALNFTVAVGSDEKNNTVAVIQNKAHEEKEVPIEQYMRIFNTVTQYTKFLFCELMEVCNE